MTADPGTPAAELDDEELMAGLRDIFGTLDYLDGAPLGADPVDTGRLASYAEFRTRICPAVLAAGTQTASSPAPGVAELLAPTAGRAVAAPSLPANEGGATDRAVDVGAPPGSSGAALPVPHTSGGGAVPESVVTRVWDRVDRQGPDDCWLWRGELTYKGYGRFQSVIEGKRVRFNAHRTVYALLIGPIPEGLVLDHLCRNRSCCNPRHLQPVTNKENILRGESFSAYNARVTHCPKGHEYTPDNITWNHKGRRCRTCHRADVLARRRRRRLTASPKTPGADDGSAASAPGHHQPSRPARAVASARRESAARRESPRGRDRTDDAGLETLHEVSHPTGPARTLRRAARITGRAVAVAVLVGLGVGLGVVLGTAGAALVLLGALYGT